MSFRAMDVASDATEGRKPTRFSLERPSDEGPRHRRKPRMNTGSFLEAGVARRGIPLIRSEPGLAAGDPSPSYAPSTTRLPRGFGGSG